MANYTEKELRNKQVVKDRKEVVALKIEQYKDHPQQPYVEFVQRKVAEYFKITFEEIVGPKHTESFFIPRCIAVRIIDDHTKLRFEIMYMFNRDRTTLYNIDVRLKDILFNPLWSKGYVKLKDACSPDVFKYENPDVEKNLDDYEALKNQL